MCALLRILGCMLVQDLFTTQFVPNRDATPTSWRRANDSGRHPIPVGAVVVHRQSGDKPGQLRFRHCGSGGHRIRKKTHGARTVRARCAHGSGNTPKVINNGLNPPIHHLGTQDSHVNTHCCKKKKLPSKGEYESMVQHCAVVQMA